MDPAISVVDLHKSYRQGASNVYALRGVSLQAKRGEFVAIMGASGSGKSTLLHLCAALDRADRGTIAVAGEAIDKMSERELTIFRRRKIGVIFQQFNLIPTLTARENVALPRELDGTMNKAANDRIDFLFEKLLMTPRGLHRPDALSGGEQQRVAIARALVMEPPVLFADEPTGNLDSVSAGQFWELLDAVTAELSTTIIMVTHEPSAARHADRVVILRDGQVAGQIMTAETADAAELALKYQAIALDKGPVRQPVVPQYESSKTGQPQ